MSDAQRLLLKQLRYETTEVADATNAENLAGKLSLLIEDAITTRQVSGDNQAAASARQIAEILIERALVEG